MKKTHLYIITDKNHSKLIVGVTQDLARHIFQLKKKDFEAKNEYSISKLVWHKSYGAMDIARQEEAKLKNNSREANLNLIRTSNPQWRDLYISISQV